MKCITCGQPLRSTRGVHRYTESGLFDVTLVNVEIRECGACGEREVVIPQIEDLHRVIAETIIHDTRRLTPERLRFLRKFLGYATADFALIMGVRPETVSRWESQAGYQMPPTAERLLRLMVANQEPATKYPLDLFKMQPQAKTTPLKLKFSAQHWRKAA